jgi:calpain-15
LLVEFTGSEKQYTDPDFPPNQESLGKLDEKTLNSMEWKRIKDICPDAIFISDKIEPGDILQGSLGDCYFLSALAALAEQEYRIKNLFPRIDMNPNGFYMARILHNGVLMEVVVDDYFPVKNGKVGFAQPAGGKEIWVMVLEKCWAKLYGSFASIVGGIPDEVLHAFSSAPVFYRPISSNK